MFDNINAYTEAVPEPTVYARADWTDDWDQIPYCRVVSLRRGTAPQIDQAVLEYEAGKMQRGNASFGALENVPRLNLDRCFIKITCPMNSPSANTLTWYGICIANTEEHLGSSVGDPILDDLDLPILDGNGDPFLDSLTALNQRFTVVGMEWMLTRIYINKSIYQSTSGSNEVNRVIPFNGGSRLDTASPDGVAKGNRHPTFFRFADPTNYGSARDWSGSNILYYLLNEFTFLDTTIPFYFAPGPGYTSYLNWWKPRDFVVGPTLFDALNQICNHRRGLTWSINTANIESPSLYIDIDVHSFADSLVSLPAGSLAANANQYDLSSLPYLKDAVSVETRDTSRVFEQIKVYGAPRCSVLSLKYSDGSLDQGWDSTQESSYINAASAVTPVAEKKRQAELYRASDRMQQVFQRHIVPTNWGGKVDSSTTVCPVIDGNGAFTTTPITMWRPELRVQNWIALRDGYNYAASASNPSDLNPTDVISGMRRPFAVYKLSSSKYIKADRLSVLARNERDGENGVSFAANVATLADDCGVWLMPSGPNHMHAKAWITTNHDIGAFNATTDHAPEVSFDEAIVTVMIEFDEYTQSCYPAIPGTAKNGQKSVLVIDVGNRARLDYLVPGTVLDVAEDGTLITAAGGLIRDDRQLLKNISQVAWQWYKKERSAITLTMRQISNELQPGDMITNYNDRNADSVVTYVTHDFYSGHTIINTDFAEIDPAGMFA